MRGQGLCRPLVAALWLTAGSAYADGGVVVMREVQGPWIITLMAEPAPLRAGPAAFSVLVQDRDGSPVLDGGVEILLTGPGLHHPIRARAQPEPGNRLFREVRAELPQSGRWQVEVRVTAPEHSATLVTEVEVGEALGHARRYWSYIALGPLGAIVIALHQARVLARQRRPAVRPARPIPAPSGQ